MSGRARIVSELEHLRTPLSEVHPDPDNPNVHPLRSIEALMESMSEHGMDQPIVARAANGQIVKGNGRYAAAQQLGWEEAAVLFVDDDEVRAIRRGLADHGSERLGYIEEDALRAALRQVDHEQNPVAGYDDSILSGASGNGGRDEDGEEDEGDQQEPGGHERLTLYLTGEDHPRIVQALKDARQAAGVETNGDLFVRMASEWNRETEEADDD